MKKLIFISFSFYVFLVLSLISFAQDDAPQLVLPIGHTARVNSIAFSPDGRYILSGSYDTTIKLWEFSTGREIRSFVGHTDAVTSVAFDPDGQHIISGSWYGSVKVWRIDTGQAINTFRPHTYWINSMVLSKDGRYILSGSGDKTIKLWELETGHIVRTFLGHSEGITSVSFSPDERYILSSSTDKTIRLWEKETGKEIRLFTCLGKKVEVWSAALSPDGRYVLANLKGNAMSLWSVTTGKEIRLFSKNTAFVYSISFSPDGRNAVTGCSDGILRLWQIDNGKQICSFLGHEKAVRSVIFSNDGRYILSCSDNGTIKLWDMITSQEIRSFSGIVDTVTFASFNSDGRYVLYGSGKNLKLFELLTGKEVMVFYGHRSLVRSAAFSPDDRYIISGSDDKTLMLWDVSTGQKIRTFSGHITEHKDAVMSVVFSPDGKSVLSGSKDKSLKLWDVSTGHNLRSFFGHKDTVYSVAFSPDGLYAVSSSADKTLKLWDISTGNEIHSFIGHENHIFSVAFSPDGAKILSGSWDGWIKLWDKTNGQVIQFSSYNPNGVRSVKFSSNGDYAISGSWDLVRLWNVYTGQEIKSFSGHRGRVMSVVFSHNERYILSCGEDKTIKLWEVSTGKLLFTRIQMNQDDWIVTTPDGRFDGSPDGIKLLHYAKDNKSIPLDSLFDRFYTPNLVAQVMSGKEIIPGTPDIRQGILMPPIVRITSPTEGQVLKEKDIEVVVESVDQGGGIEDVRLYHNDKRIIGDERGMKKSDKTQTKFTVSLINGINTIRATAFSKDRTESHPYEIKLKVDVAEATSDLYIVAIGINEYKNSNYTLNYCVPDAQAIIAVMSERGKSIFRNVNLRTVFDDQATKAGIESALSHVEKDSRPEDVFVFYYSGHGVMSEGDENKPADFYLVPYDVTELYGNDAILDEKGFSAALLRDTCQRIKATKQLLIIDSCQSGKMVDTFAMKGASEEKAIAQLARSAGITVIAATQNEQIAVEFKKIKHGLFTYTLLQGMEGEADGSPKDNRITVSELSAYVQAQIPELSKKHRGESQYPKVYMRGQDFPIVMKK